jgi:hypothetical protein
VIRQLARLVHAELLKVATIRSTWGLVIAGIALALANLGVLLLLTAPSLDADGLAQVASQPDAQALVLGTASQGALFAMLIGVLASTGEIRHRTWSTTVLITPRRWPVLVAKVKAMAIVGALMALACLLVLEVVGQITFLGRMALNPGSAALTILGTCLAFALYCALGACLGALVRGQVPAIVIVLVGSFALEPLVGVIWPDYATWLPGSAVSLVGSLGTVDTAVFLQGLAALVAWVLVVGVSAGATSLRRDVT